MCIKKGEKNTRLRFSILFYFFALMTISHYRVASASIYFSIHPLLSVSCTYTYTLDRARTRTHKHSHPIRCFKRYLLGWNRTETIIHVIVYAPFWVSYYWTFFGYITSDVHPTRIFLHLFFSVCESHLLVDINVKMYKSIFNISKDKLAVHCKASWMQCLSSTIAEQFSACVTRKHIRSAFWGPISYTFI